MLLSRAASPRGRGGRLRGDGRRRWVRTLAVAVVVLLLPVPWQHQADSDLGLVWRLDRRLVVEGERLDPPGRWSWLTVGRPPVVGEVAWQRGVRLVDPTATGGARDLRVGSEASRPVNAEPDAAALGLAAAGRATLLVDGQPAPVDAVIGGHGPPYSWFRSLSMGSSHGLMVALVTYTAASGEDLAGGRHVAGTGKLDQDGLVGRIGGLVAKARGAQRAGADVLLVPAEQRELLDGVDLGDVHVLGVTTLDDAIVQLRASLPAG